jgi:hypothetical protein
MRHLTGTSRYAVESGVISQIAWGRANFFVGVGVLGGIIYFLHKYCILLPQVNKDLCGYWLWGCMADYLGGGAFEP